MTERKDAEIIYNSYIIHFFYNLPSINFRMRHDKEKKMCQGHLYNIYNLPAINFRMRHDRERKDVQR